MAMQITDFREMYTAELQELSDAELRMAEALRRMAEVASNPTLKDQLMRNQVEALAQKEKLDGLLVQHGADPKAHTDQAMQSLVHETEKMMSILQGDKLRDAGLVASAQKLKHYEIAAYGTVAALAGQLDLRDDQQLLHASLEEEKRADALFTALAKSVINPGAVAAA
jgi:ferritin-like metal-binding protein YciE